MNPNMSVSISGRRSTDKLYKITEAVEDPVDGVFSVRILPGPERNTTLKITFVRHVAYQGP